MVQKSIKTLVVIAVFLFPLVVFKNLAFPFMFSHSVFIFSIIEFLLLLFVFLSIQRNELVFRKSWIIAGLGLYIFIMVLTAITGPEFGYSFWSNQSRMTGIITWLHYLAFFLILSSLVIEEKDWRNIFRALLLSGFFLAVFSFLGTDGVALESFEVFRRGGSFLGNTSYSGAYELLIFFLAFIGFSFETRKVWKGIYIISLLLLFFNPDLFNFSIWKGEVALGDAFRDPKLFMGMARTSSLVLWGGSILAGILWCISRFRNKRTVVVIASALLVILTALYAYGFASLLRKEGNIYDAYVEESGPARLLVWHMAVEGIKERPVLGYGNGNFKYIFQEHLDPQIIHFEDPPWFDRVHNFTLQELVDGGILGFLAMFGLFVTITVVSFRLYVQEKRYYLLLIPFIFFLHFLQLQTFFQVNSTLFLMFILLALLVWHEEKYSVSLARIRHQGWWKMGAFILFLIAFILFVIIPVRQSRLVVLLTQKVEVPAERLELQQRLYHLWINPTETLRQITMTFADRTAMHGQDIKESGLGDDVAKEYEGYIQLYEHYMPRYKDNHRYLYEYANVINAAYIFGVDHSARAEEVARESLAISDRYPHPYWMLAISLYYQGKNAEALRYAKEGYDLDPTIIKSKKVYDFMKRNARPGKPLFIHIPEV